jgi:asparagine synthase (glutamine-hydrolysing)
MGFREYQGSLKDEVPLAEACARRHGTVHTTRIVTGTDFQTELGRFWKSMDQPTLDGLNTYFVSKVAAELGMKVCLSGIGGDEMFGGYGTFSRIPRVVQLTRRLLPSVFSGRALRRVSARWIGRLTSPKYAGLFEFGRTIEGAYLLNRGLFMPWELPHILPPEMVREGWLQLEPMARLSESVSGLGDSRLAVASLEMRWYMRNQLLRDADWAGMAHSVEIRVPFVDVQLLRDLAPDLCGPEPVMKPLVASTCGLDLAPRPKTGFSIPVHEWFREQTGAKEGGCTRGLRGWARYSIAEIYGPKWATAVP